MAKHNKNIEMKRIITYKLSKTIKTNRNQPTSQTSQISKKRDTFNNKSVLELRVYLVQILTGHLWRLKEATDWFVGREQEVEEINSIFNVEYLVVI